METHELVTTLRKHVEHGLVSLKVLPVNVITYMIFFPVMIARSPRIVPGLDASGLVAPIIFRLRQYKVDGS